MTIGQLSLESGLPASTIRYWERIGVLPKPHRVSGQRLYTRESLQRLAVLRLGTALRIPPRRDAGSRAWL